ncbi:MAG: AAA family ATPase [Anaerolineales bacterium]
MDSTQAAMPGFSRWCKLCVLSWPGQFISQGILLADSEIFVGRQPELDRLGAALVETLAGHGSVALVAGEAGSGKTSLLRAFLSQAEPKNESLVTAWGDCSDVEGQSDPYLPFREVLALLTGDFEDAPDKNTVSHENQARLRGLLAKSGQILVDVGPDLINLIIPGTRLAGIMGKAVARRVGWLEKLDGLAKKAPSEPAVGGPALTQDRVFEEYTDFLSELSVVCPLVIVLDDLQWADAASTGLLFHLGKRIAERRILLLGAYRPDDLAERPDGSRHPLEHVINEFKRSFGDVIIDLSSSSGTQSEEFVNQLIDAEPNRLDADFRQGLYQRTEGHPLFVVELLRMLREKGELSLDDDGHWVAQPDLNWSAAPPRVEGVIQERLARLDETELQILHAASVEGDIFTAEVVADVLSLEPRQVVSDLSELLGPRRGLIESAGTRRVESGRVSQYRFHHHMVRDHIYKSIDPAQRAYLHEDVAASLTRRFAGELDDVASALARHYGQAGLWDQAVRFGQMAGDRAYRMNAYEDALTHYADAAALTDRVPLERDQLVELYLRWGRSYELISQREPAIACYRALESIGDQRDDPRIRLAAQAAEVIVLAIATSLHDAERSRQLAKQALDLARELGDQATEAKLLWSLSLISTFEGLSQEGIAWGEQALPLARQLDLREQQAYILNDLIEPYAIVGEIDKARAAAEEAVGLWKSLDNQPMLANTITQDARVAFYIGDLSGTEAMAEDALTIGRKLGNHTAVSFALTMRGLSMYQRGELSQSLGSLQESYTIGEEAGDALPATGIRAEAAWVMAYMGCLDEAKQVVDEAVATAREVFPPALSWTLAILTRIYLLAGLPTDHLIADDPEVVLTDELANQAGGFQASAVGFAATEAAFARGDMDQALKAAEAWIDMLERRHARVFLPDALTLRGKIFRAEGDKDRAKESLTAAADLARAIGSPRAEWPALSILAEMEAAAGEADNSRAHLIQARSALEHLAAGIHDEAHMKSFTARPEVKALLEAAGPLANGEA